MKNRSLVENTVEEWIECLKCPVIRIDGIRPVAENVNFIIEQMEDQGSDYHILRQRMIETIRYARKTQYEEN